MRISDQDRRALVLLSSFGLAMALYLLAVEPFLNRLDALASSRAKAEEALAKGERERRMLDMRRQRLNESRNELDAATDLRGLAVPAGRRTLETIAGLRRAADDAGVALAQVRPVPVPGDPFAGIALDVECTGAWEKLLRMVHRLETQPELVQVERVEVSRPENGDVRGRLRVVRWFRAEAAAATGLVAGSSERSFQVALTPTIGSAPVLVAEAEGRLRTPAAAWEVITGPASEVLGHVRSGDAEAAVVHATSLLTLQADGVPVVAVAALTRELAAVALAARPGSGVSAVTDLPGKSVAALRRESGHFWLYRMCRDAGVDINRVRIAPMPMVAGAEALAKQEVDAAMLRDPWLGTAVREGTGKVVAAPRADDVRSWILLVTTRRMAEEQPDAVRALVAAAFASQPTLASPAADQVLARALWQSPAQVAALRERIAWVGVEESRVLLGGALAGDLAPFAEFLTRACAVDVPAEALKAFDPRYLPAAVQEPAAP